MPIWEYDCDKCGELVEAVWSYERRDDPQVHEGCGGNLVRRGVQQFAMGKPSFQPGAVLSDGTKVPGHFGKSAPKKGGWNPK